jgi:membrane protease YdiL (CAAX protease family)
MYGLSVQAGVNIRLFHQAVVTFVIRNLRQISTWLLVETFLVTLVAVAALRILSLNPTLSASWLVAPAVLVAAALVPTVLRRGSLPALGLDKTQVGLALRLVGVVSLTLLPLTFIFLWVTKLSGLCISVRPVQRGAGELLGWLFYQFMYVAVAEEVFFRGYVLSNILRLVSSAEGVRRHGIEWTAIIVSAACFAAAHLVVRGDMTSLLVFFPGLVFGWLYVRTRALVAPILFHGIANTFYLVATLILA